MNPITQDRSIDGATLETTTIEAIKKCSKCQETKNLADFHNSKTAKDGKQSNCKACCRAYTQNLSPEEKKKRTAKSEEWRRANQDILNKRQNEKRRNHTTPKETKAKSWVTEVRKQNIIFSAPIKINEVYAQILTSVIETGDIGGLYGNGGDYEYMKLHAPSAKRLFLDDGRSLDNEEILKEKFANMPDCKFISFRDQAKTGTEAERKGTWFIDYCGQFSTSLKEDLKIIDKVLKDKGYIYITIMKGREDLLPAGTDRMVIDEAIDISFAKLLKSAGLKATPHYKIEYPSTPEYEGRKTCRPTIMGVYGFKYSKIKPSALAQLKTLLATRINIDITINDINRRQTTNS